MTAEIAILNRSAVALAADSAGTIGQGGTAKIYNAFNKIFALSESEPVGVMIYGGLDFMGLPLESIIKQYREKLGSTSFPHIDDYLKNFLSFLENYIPWKGPNEDTRTATILLGCFSRLANIVEQRVNDDLSARGKYLRSKDNSIIERVLLDDLKALRAHPFLDNFHKKLPADAKDRWQQTIESTSDYYFREYKLTQANQKRLVEVGFQTLLRSRLSDGRTGIVIAGFGREEWCPSLAAIETDGVVLGKLKYASKENLDIDRGGPHAAMVGFAQDDMVSTFLNGVDPRYETYVNESMGTFFGELMEPLKLQPGTTDEQVTAWKTFFDHVRSEMNKKLLDFRNKSFKTPIIEMIRFMPTQELATLAASMIEITSLKRRVTRERETVGGDVDVAVITKAEARKRPSRISRHRSRVHPVLEPGNPAGRSRERRGARGAATGRQVDGQRSTRHRERSGRGQRRSRHALPGS